MWYFEAVSRCGFQTYRSNIRTVNKQMLIWRHTCFVMTSLIAQCTFKIVNWYWKSASVSLLLFSKSFAHIFVAKILSINGIFLVAGTKLGLKFSRDFCSSANSVLVKLMTTCLIYDVVFCLSFFSELFFSFLNLLIGLFFFFVNFVSFNFSVLLSISAKCSSFILHFKFSGSFFR